MLFSTQIFELTKNEAWVLAQSFATYQSLLIDLGFCNKMPSSLT